MLVQLIKTIYFVAQCYFSGAKIAHHRTERERVQQQVQKREAIETKVVLAFKQAFGVDKGIVTAAQVKGQFDTFARFHENLDFSQETNVFMDREELEGTPLALITNRCQSRRQPRLIHSSDLLDSSEEKTNESEEEEIWFDCCSEEKTNGIEESIQKEISPLTGQSELTIKTLFSNLTLYEMANHFLPLSLVKSIEKVEERTYCLTFEGPLVGCVENLKEGFAEKLEGIIRRRFREGSDILKNLRKFYPVVGTFLDVIDVKSLEDITRVVYWEGLLGAWRSAEGSYCHLPETVTIRIEEAKLEILEGAFRAGVHITGYHLIKGNLLNRAFQAALYTCLKGLGFVTWGGSTRKPLHSTFSINAFQWFEGQEGFFLHVNNERERGLSFEYNKRWQVPQNFSAKDLQALEQDPWKQINRDELDLIKAHFVWKIIESKESFLKRGERASHHNAEEDVKYRSDSEFFPQ